MLGLDIEPVVYCLFCSLVWAPAVYIGAMRIDRGRRPAISELIWLGALGAAVLPTLLAPALAAAGVSLRPAPVAAVLPMSPKELVFAATAFAANPPADAAPVISFDVIIKAVGLLYVYGAILAFVMWATRAAAFAIHVGRARPTDYPELYRALEVWRRRLGVIAPLQIKKSGSVSSVCVFGLRRPVILIPTDLDARVSFDDLVLMGAHELAHVRRGDCVFFAVCSAARILFWFNPFVKRLAARAELAAERSADRMVLEAGADRRAYAACFIEGLRFAAERARETRVAVPSFTPFDRRSRRDRLDAILSGKSDPRRSSRLFMAAAVASAAVLAFAQAAFAVDPERRDVDAADSTPKLIEDEATLADGDPVAGDPGAAGLMHKKIDIKLPNGASITAPAEGVVIEATDVYRDKPSWGKVVVIRHSDGVVTRYAHLGSYSVRRGDRVKAGEVIGTVGASGAANGPRLRFETFAAAEPAVPTPTPAEPRPAAPAAAAEPGKPGVAAAQPPTAAPAPKPVAPAELVAPVIALLDGAGPRALLRLNSEDQTTNLALQPMADDHPAFASVFSDADRESLHQSLQEMRREINRAKREHKRQIAKLKSSRAADELVNFDFDSLFSGQFDFGDLEVEGLDIDSAALEDLEIDPDFLAALSAEDNAAMERWQEDHDWAMRSAEGERAESERAREEVRRARQMSQREIEVAREEALRRRAEAIEQAERDLAAERARIEEMLSDIAAKRKQRGSVVR